MVKRADQVISPSGTVSTFIDISMDDEPTSALFCQLLFPFYGYLVLTHGRQIHLVSGRRQEGQRVSCRYYPR